MSPPNRFVNLHSLFALITDPRAVSAPLGRNGIQGLGIAAAIVFLETGIVIFPFLPGDSLPFALGAFPGASGHSLLAAWSAIAAAAVLGDAVAPSETSAPPSRSRVAPAKAALR
jgi:membrane-associated protein